MQPGEEILGNSAVLGAIRDIFGDRSSFSEIDRACYSFDATGVSVLPDGVVFPENEREVRELLILANRFSFPVIPRGAGTGFSGGTVPIKGGVVLSFERMDSIIDIDEKNMTARVMPGVVLECLREEVKRRGLYYPPDPASKAFCTIGGNIAECAGGPSAFKYGVTKHYVLSLRNVLPTGESVETGVSTVKGVVGYDITGLLVGSEGTLTVVTEAVLKLVPHPESFSTILTAFRDMEEASTAVNEIVSSKVMPSAIELMDKTAVDCVREHGDIPIHEDAGCYLLVELDGFEEEVRVRSLKFMDTLSRLGPLSINVGETEDEREALWAMRRAISPSLLKLNPKKINEDITVPRTKLPAMMGHLSELSEESGIPIVSFGHAGDGNIHVNIMIDDSSPEEVRKAGEIVRRVFSLTVEMGGTISGEHGVGLSKKPYLSMELGEDQIKLMKGLKHLFDPNLILNPHKIFPD